MSDHTPHHYECSETIALLFPYLDRELDPVEQAKVRAHLEECGNCSQLFRFEATMLTLVGERLARMTAPAELRSRIQNCRDRADGRLMTPDPLRLAITGGGTGGHVSPALAVDGALRARLAPSGRPLELLWIGSEDGVERAAATRPAPLRRHPNRQLRRYLTLATVRDAARLPLGLLAARRALTAFRPHVLFSTGGFVSVPAVLASRLLGIPSLTHEQTVTVGLANRINARVASRIALSYAVSRTWLPRHPFVGGVGEQGSGEQGSGERPSP